MPHGLRIVFVDFLDRVHGVVHRKRRQQSERAIRWPTVAVTQRRDTDCVWRKAVRNFGRASSLQHAPVPRGLPDVPMEHVDNVHPIVRPGRAISIAHRGYDKPLGRRSVRGLRTKSNVQHASVRRALRGFSLQCVDGVYHVLRLRYPKSITQRHNGGDVWRIRVPVSG